MEINENPMSYQDVVVYLQEFEAKYHVDTEDYFSRLDKGEGSIEVDSDDLYEWRSYFEFKKVIESKLKTALQDSQLEDGVPFSEVGNSELKEQGRAERANNNLALAA